MITKNAENDDHQKLSKMMITRTGSPPNPQAAQPHCVRSGQSTTLTFFKFDFCWTSTFRFLYNQRMIIIKYFRAKMVLKVKPLRGWNVVQARAEEQTRGRSDPAPTTWRGDVEYWRGIRMCEYIWFSISTLIILHCFSKRLNCFHPFRSIANEHLQINSKTCFDFMG